MSYSMQAEIILLGKSCFEERGLKDAVFYYSIKTCADDFENLNKFFVAYLLF